ncbi:hypothetical protein KC974_01695, partial [Candidatus Saccharibacteria bacterium]|nr:hypothetical protein [Candidatus Saccharibacteria bacterium]
TMKKFHQTSPKPLSLIERSKQPYIDLRSWLKEARHSLFLLSLTLQFDSLKRINRILTRERVYNSYACSKFFNQLSS